MLAFVCACISSPRFIVLSSKCEQISTSPAFCGNKFLGFPIACNQSLPWGPLGMALAKKQIVITDARACQNYLNCGTCNQSQPTSRTC